MVPHDCVLYLAADIILMIIFWIVTSLVMCILGVLLRGITL